MKLDVINPSTLEAIDAVPLVDWRDLDGWLDEMGRLHRSRSVLPKYRRIEILTRAAALMRGRRDELAALIAMEGGKPLRDAQVEADRAINSVELAVHELHAGHGQEVPMDLTPSGANRTAFTTHEPIGPVVAISAFNHPLNLIVHQVAPAVATGCPVIVKPADDTPLSARAFVQILHEAGLDEEWCRFAPCEVTAAQKLATDPRTAFLSFIGSAKIGWMLRSRLAAGTRCALEHGGAAPVIIDDGVKWDDIFPLLLRGGYYHSGQVCVSVQRIFVPAGQEQDFAEAFADRVKGLVVGDASSAMTDCGPLIRPAEVDRVERWVGEVDKSKVITGGHRISDAFFSPTVLLEPDADASVSTLEIFGPVVCVYGYDTLDNALARANALPFAFQSAVFTQRLPFAMQCIHGLDAAAVMVNDHPAFRVDWMPFAGQRQSGYGIGGIGHTMKDMTQEKMAVIFSDPAIGQPV